MAKSFNQKAKILFLERILRETGENHVVTMQEILDILSASGITAERKSIYDDMEALRSFGMDVKYRRGKPGGYYLAGQTVSEESLLTLKTANDNQIRTNQEEQPQRNGVVWSFEGKSKPGEKKLMTLFCEKAREEEIRGYFGDLAVYEADDSELLIVEAPVSTDPQFFGWLTAMGNDARLRRPKKAAQIYREYLKAIARDYKGITKKED